MSDLLEPLRSALSSVGATLTAEPIFDPKTTERAFTFAMSDLGEMVFMPKILRRVRQLAPRAAVRSAR